MFVAIQLIPIDRTNPPVVEKNNFVSIYKTPANIQALLKASCYDCHSNETKYPNYSYVAPISWMIKDHINEGREYLNFSEWGTYNKDLKQGAIEKSIDAIKNYQMPLSSYVSKHPAANLTTKQRKELEDYFSSIKFSK